MGGIALLIGFAGTKKSRGEPTAQKTKSLTTLGNFDKT
jgi:hypothetical protein